MEWVVHVARTEEKRHGYRVLVEKPEGRGHLEDLGKDGEINVNMDPKEIGWDGTR
jgi:hypothetical protein